MSDPKSRPSDAYRNTRAAFDELNIEEKAVFVVESVLTTFAQTLESIFRTVAHEIDRAVDQMECKPNAEAEMPGVEEIIEEEPVAEDPPPKKPKKAASSGKKAKKGKKK
ncbi:MAG: hypothetical protein AAGJ10_06315 [Bacteroidota bacterium]